MTERVINKKTVDEMLEFNKYYRKNRTTILKEAKLSVGYMKEIMDNIVEANKNAGKEKK